MKKLLAYAGMFALALGAPFLRSDEEKPKADIVETAVEAGKFKTLAKALTEAGLVEALKGEGPFTVFAPNDEAFEKLGKETLEEVLKDKEKLTAILKYHVVSGKVPAKTVVTLDGKSAKTLGGKEVKIEVKDGKVVLNGKINVIKTDIMCKNGIIHVIDAVLVPEKE